MGSIRVSCVPPQPLPKGGAKAQYKRNTSAHARASRYSMGSIRASCAPPQPLPKGGAKAQKCKRCPACREGVSSHQYKRKGLIAVLAASPTPQGGLSAQKLHVL